jgi:hypothetical protein
VRDSDCYHSKANDSVTSAVTGRLAQHHRVRHLADAPRVFAGRRVSVAIKAGLRSTVLTAADPHEDDLDVHYVVMPIPLRQRLKSTVDSRAHGRRNSSCARTDSSAAGHRALSTSA